LEKRNNILEKIGGKGKRNMGLIKKGKQSAFGERRQERKKEKIRQEHCPIDPLTRAETGKRRGKKFPRNRKTLEKSIKCQYQMFH